MAACSEELLLRRTQSIASRDEGETVGAMRADIERAFGSDEGLQRFQPRTVKPGNQTDDAPRAEPRPGFTPKADRRKGERRGMDALRDEALRSVIAKVEDKNFGGLRNRVNWRSRLPVSRIVLLLVAILAGGAAAFLATRSDRAPVVQPAEQPVTEIVKEPTSQILVASKAIGIGERLSAASLQWADWPEGAVRSEYISAAAAPQAIAEMSGSVVRFEFFPGEPIRAEKLALPGQGYLSAVLGSGMRGVSVMVAAEAASGGFIVPNDHVDVVLTRPTATGQVSETVLSNVRVLAINARLGEAGTTGAPADPEDPRAEIFSDSAIATLELDGVGAEVIINATTLGQLSLVLRSTVDNAEAEDMAERAANQAIRLTSPFWSNNPGGPQ